MIHFGLRTPVLRLRLPVLALALELSPEREQGILYVQRTYSSVLKKEDAGGWRIQRQSSKLFGSNRNDIKLHLRISSSKASKNKQVVQIGGCYQRIRTADASRFLKGFLEVLSLWSSDIISAFSFSF